MYKNYIEKDNQELYENKFGENVTEYELYHLSTVSQNLINWYPFNTKRYSSTNRRRFRRANTSIL